MTDPPAAQRVRLDVSYDGTDFSGWAAQPDRRTVAGELTAALTRLAGEGAVTNLTAAGRTDAGVHATGQVCHVGLPPEAWERLAAALVHRLAAVLPPDVRVTAATAVPPEFDARFSALARTYAYRVSDARWGVAPLRRRDTLRWRALLDPALLNAAAAGLTGTHDFAAYCRHQPHRSTVRTVRRLEWRRERDGVLVAEVEADAFCQAMVRSLVGAMLAAGDGSRPVAWPAGLLARATRAGEVRVAPPHGLTLVAVAYPSDPAGWAARARVTRGVRTPGGSAEPASPTPAGWPAGPAPSTAGGPR